MRRTTLFPVLLLLAIARIAAAHIAPIDPSLCAFDPITFRVPATGATGAAAAATAADTMRIVYDAPASHMQICSTLPTDTTQCGPAVPRPFTLASTTGTLGFPSIFPGTLLASGDVTLTSLPITFTVGASSAVVPVTLTTGLTTLGATVLEGAPLTVDTFRLVGVVAGDALPPPLTGQPLVMEVSCKPLPFPDEDQFGVPLKISTIKGKINGTHASLRATAQTLTATPPVFGGQTALLALHVDGTTVASAVFSAGLTGGPRKFKGTSDDGHTVVQLRTRAGGGLVITLRFNGMTSHAVAPSGRVPVDLTLDVGGLLGRGEQTFRANGKGVRLHSA